MMFSKNNKPDEKRKYIRLNTVFPIEFQVIGKEGNQPLSELREGFTRDVGKGGMGICARSLKEHDKELFNFTPRETKLKLLINIPLDEKPIESVGTVQWIEHKPGPITDTYLFGIAYDSVNDEKYKKIIAYIKWLRMKPKLTALIIVLLITIFAFSLVALFKVNARRAESEKKWMASVSESRRAELARQVAQEEKSKIEMALKAAEEERTTLAETSQKFEEERNALSEISKLSEEQGEELKIQLEELSRDKELLEEQLEQKATEQAEKVAAEILSETAEEIAGLDVKNIADARIKAEEPNYKKFRELILNEKIQGLDAYIYSHRSSIYHAAALFALAELRYKYGERALSSVNYNEVIELYPKSKYALYSSHRLDQLRKNYNYDFYTLKDFQTNYNLPELFDYRHIEPYVK